VNIVQGSEVNILIGHPTERDVELLFSPREGDLFLTERVDITWPQLLNRLGCFPSVSQARKNWEGQGRDLEIPWGYTELTIGKARRIFIFICKETEVQATT
jgi:hypothetical protein